MKIEKIKKADAVNVVMIFRNAWGEINEKTVIATFRNENWAKDFLNSPHIFDELTELVIEKAD